MKMQFFGFTIRLHMLFSIGLFAYIPLHAAPHCAKVAVVIGRVVNEEGRAIVTGQQLSQGTQVATDKTSLAKLILADDSVLDLGSSTKITLNSCQGKTWGSKINLKLEQGALRSLVNKSPKIRRDEFILKTPTSILAVRGTEFFVSWQQDVQGQVRENIGVTEGKVEIRSLFDQVAAPLMVTTGTQFRAEGQIQRQGSDVKVLPDAAPKVDQFTAQEQRNFEQNTKVENRVFENTLEIPKTSTGENQVRNSASSAGTLVSIASKDIASLNSNREMAEENARSSSLTSSESARNTRERRTDRSSTRADSNSQPKLDTSETSAPTRTPSSTSAEATESRANNPVTSSGASTANADSRGSSSATASSSGYLPVATKVAIGSNVALPGSGSAVAGNALPSLGGFSSTPIFTVGKANVFWGVKP